MRLFVALLVAALLMLCARVNAQPFSSWDTSNQEDNDDDTVCPSPLYNGTRQLELAILDLAVLLFNSVSSAVALREAADKVYGIGSMLGEEALSIRRAVEIEGYVQRSIENRRRYEETGAVIQEMIRASKEIAAKYEKKRAEHKEWLRQREERMRQEAGPQQREEDDAFDQTLAIVALSIWTAYMSILFVYSITSFVYRSSR